MNACRVASRQHVPAYRLTVHSDSHCRGGFLYEGSLHAQATPLSACLVACFVRSLPENYRIYHQKSSGTYALFYQNKQVKGTISHVRNEGSHQGKPKGLPTGLVVIRDVWFHHLATCELLSGVGQGEVSK